MPTNRSYRDSCGIARALDVVGERWALLVVRELLLAPRRFSELRHALPGVSSNLLADRLRELEHHGVVRQEAKAYALTARGRQLEPILVALGDWGIEAPHPEGPATLSATSVLIFLRGHARLDPAAPPEHGRLELDGQVWTLVMAGGRVDVRAGEPATAAFSLRTDPATFSALLVDPAGLAAARASVVGDPAALDRLLRSVGAPHSPPS